MTRESTTTLVGQSMMFRFEGPVFTAGAQEAFREIRPGGVIFFGDNITSRTQIHALTAELRDHAAKLGMPPLFIAADQEGGIVSRFSPDMTTVPGAMALSATGELADIRTSARITGEQLAAVGINTNFAPVVDVNNNPVNPVIRTRSFGDTVEQVIAGSLAAIDGLNDAGIIGTVKHFPGHGDTSVDSHLGLPVVNHSRERLDAVELAPFRAAIAAGVPGVMTTHILFPELDQDPATLSRAILTGVLRNDLGFDGVIFTDSLSMAAIEARYGHGDAAIRCKLAGVDVLEANESIAHQRSRFHALIDAARDGTVPLAIFERTVERLVALRSRFAIGRDPGPLGGADPAWDTTAREIAARAIVALPEGGFLPIRPDANLGVIDFQRLRATEAEDPFNRAGVFRTAAMETFTNARVVTLGNTPRQEEIDEAISLASDVETLVVMTRDAALNPNQVEIGTQAISRAGEETRIIHVALRGPYDRGIFGDVDATILTFGDPAVTLRVLPGALGGATSITARLPIRLGGATDR
ncbi:MAG TPA: glycoside hydrolase family 3 protein [Thermomicrobiales bacterium]|nr:glycoside hydrolase family 3 protein [Thermomicrobiales bacterium]